MNNATTTFVTQTRLKQLLEYYDSSSSLWPKEGRRVAINLLKGSPDLQTLREQIQPLDNILTELRNLERGSIDQHAVQSLQQRTISQLPDQESSESHTEEMS